MADPNVDSQQALLDSLLASYPVALQNSANTAATARMQQNRMDRTRWGGKGLLGALAGMIGNKVADKRRPELEGALSDAFMAKAQAADQYDRLGRFRDIAQNKIESSYEHELKAGNKRDEYYRARGGEIDDRDNERAYQARLLDASNAREDTQKTVQFTRDIEKKETPNAPAPLTDKDRQTYQAKLLDVNDARTILDNAEAALKSRSGQPDDNLLTKVGKSLLPDTGPVDQYMPGRWGQGFDAMSEQLFAVAKRIYKSPGEGMFSDADAKALKGMLFGSGNYADVNIKLINDMRSMLGDRAAQLEKMAGDEGSSRESIEDIIARNSGG